MNLISFLDYSHLAICQTLSDVTESWALSPFYDVTSTANQHYQIQKHLQSDLLACDARLSLFVAAANSYRYESLVRPFPEEFLDSKGSLDINAIFDVLADFDRLETILQQILNGEYCSSHKNVLKLLHDVLVKHGEFVALSTLQPRVFNDLYAHLKIPAPKISPTQIFEVTPSLKCEHTKAYTSLREKYPARMGFYDGKLEELYSMLTVGCLPQNEPIKLTCNVNDALSHSQYGNSWGASRCGAMLTCVAVVEFLVVPSQVTIEENKHVIVRDQNCMQISYLFFFGKSFTQCTFESTFMLEPKIHIDWHETIKWLKTKKYAISLGVYLMILSMAFSNGPGILYRLATSGMYRLRKGFLPILF